MKIIKSIIYLFLFILTTIPLSAFADRGKSNLDFEVISHGGQSGIDHQMSMVVDSIMHWEHLWMMHTKMQAVPEMLPKVDFDTEIVVAQFLGPVASCGYDINTEKVKNKRDYLEVKTIVKLPSGPINCLIAEQPYEIIKFARTTNRLVKFKFEFDDD